MNSKNKMLLNRLYSYLFNEQSSSIISLIKMYYAISCGSDSSNDLAKGINSFFVKPKANCNSISIASYVDELLTWVCTKNKNNRACLLINNNLFSISVLHSKYSNIFDDFHVLEEKYEGAIFTLIIIRDISKGQLLNWIKSSEDVDLISCKIDTKPALKISDQNEIRTSFISAEYNPKKGEIIIIDFFWKALSPVDIMVNIYREKIFDRGIIAGSSGGWKEYNFKISCSNLALNNSWSYASLSIPRELLSKFEFRVFPAWSSMMNERPVSSQTSEILLKNIMVYEWTG